MNRTISLRPQTTFLDAIPEGEITCQACGALGPGNQDGIKLCPACLQDIDSTRRRLHERMERVFGELDVLLNGWRSTLEDDPKVAQWWEEAQDKPELHKKALALGGRGARIVGLWRVFCMEFDKCAVEKDKIHKGQTEVNTALLAKEGVL
jgi:hypothetical protein